MTDRINIHHIGGRDGSFPFPINERFTADLIVHLYDGDENCMAQMDTMKKTRADTRAHVRLFAGKTGEATLNISYDPYSSSLLPVNPDYIGATRYLWPNDFTYGDMNAVVETVSGQATSIDDFVRESGETIDIFTLDVEGAEPDLLAGAATTLRQSAVAVYTEVTFFHRFLSGQKLFGDICTQMDQAGFRLVWMKSFGDYELSRRPIGFRGQGVPTGGDCLFLKMPEAIRRDHPDPDLSLAKLAFAALSWSQLDQALSALDLVGDVTRLQDRCRSYGRFLAEIRHVYRVAPKLFPPLFSDVWSHERSFARFQPQFVGKMAIDFERVRERVLTRYRAEDFLKGLVANSGPALSTPFEQLLHQNDFVTLAKEVSEARMQMTSELISSLGLVTEQGELDQPGLREVVSRYCRRT